MRDQKREEEGGHWWEGAESRRDAGQGGAGGTAAEAELKVKKVAVRNRLSNKESNSKMLQGLFCNYFHKKTKSKFGFFRISSLGSHTHASARSSLKAPHTPYLDGYETVPLPILIQ